MSEDFDAVVEFLSEGIETGRGRRAAYLHHDRVNEVLRGRRGAHRRAHAVPIAFPSRRISTNLRVQL